MIDIRYHVYSLAAVFLALALGIIIGTSFGVGSPAALSERKVITRYEESAKVLKQEIEKASDDVSRYKKIMEQSESLANASEPYFTKDKLKWRKVAIVVTGDNDSEVGAIRNSLTLAGAEISSVTILNTEFDFQDIDIIKKVLAKCNVAFPEDDDAIENKLISIIANTVSLGVHPEMVSALADADIASFSGDYSKEAKLVVLVGGSAEILGISNIFDKAFISNLKYTGVRIVGSESSAAKFSYIKDWQKSKIASVDNIDYSIGRMSLVYALLGENGQFGIKATADRFYPSALEQK